MTGKEDTYLTLSNVTEGLYKEKGSRFIALGYPIASEAEALSIIKAVKDKYHDARHHCWAYRLGCNGEAYRLNDDGEPSGTAGKPIYGVILSNSLTNVLFVVVRYFGGIKLGTSGLIEAYRLAVRDSLAKASIIEKQVMKMVSFTFSYEQIGTVMKTIKNIQAKITETKIEVPCRISLEIRASEYNRLIDSLLKTDTVKITE